MAQIVDAYYEDGENAKYHIIIGGMEEGLYYHLAITQPAENGQLEGVYCRMKNNTDGGYFYYDGQMIVTLDNGVKVPREYPLIATLYASNSASSLTVDKEYESYAAFIAKLPTGYEEEDECVVPMNRWYWPLTISKKKAISQFMKSITPWNDFVKKLRDVSACSGNAFSDYSKSRARSGQVFTAEKYNLAARQLNKFNDNGTTNVPSVSRGKTMTAQQMNVLVQSLNDQIDYRNEH